LCYHIVRTLFPYPLGGVRYCEASAKTDSFDCHDALCESVRACWAFDSYMTGDYKIDYRSHLPLRLGKKVVVGKMETKNKKKGSKKSKK
jgi:hypothetical protein